MNTDCTSGSETGIAEEALSPGMCTGVQCVQCVHNKCGWVDGGGQYPKDQNILLIAIKLFQVISTPLTRVTSTRPLPPVTLPTHSPWSKL